ncbi:MAG: hypothetical protein OXR73_12190 [Myxococcales bacterium]|nr:hypothetical protein [Myxococcales bacterium]
MTSGDTLLAFAIIVASGLVLGDVATRLRFPRVTGWIAAGILLQFVHVPGLSAYAPHAQFGPFVEFVLDYIAVVSSPLNLERLRNAHKRLMLLALTEAIVTPTVVALSLLWIGGQSATLSWVLGTIAIAGAPGTTLVVLREARARGVFTKTLTLAGMRLDFRHLGGALMLVALFFLARVVAKVASGYLAMTSAGMIPTARRYLGLALLPHGGVAIGLILVVQESPGLASIANAATTVGLSALALNQLVGPSVTRWTLNRVGEVGLDRPRLLDFLSEQNIVTGSPVQASAMSSRGSQTDYVATLPSAPNSRPKPSGRATAGCGGRADNLPQRRADDAPRIRSAGRPDPWRPGAVGQGSRFRCTG